ncbi:MAG: aminotransferase class I/II-fold pyridoxal phosphate-dependent enzyme [Nonlabens sp.]
MSFDLKRLVRKNIWDLQAYSSARSEFQLYGETGSQDLTLLDANENPHDVEQQHLNRYPDPLQNDIKKLVAEEKGLSPENVFMGNGSDEAIDLLYRIFCEPGSDSVITCPPTYGMYEVSAAINDVKVVQIPLKADFNLDMDRLLENDAFKQAKLLWICSPNNPSGNTLLKADLPHDWAAVNYTQGGMMDMPFAPEFEQEMMDNERQMNRLFGSFEGIVVIDEAYQDFTENMSFTRRLEDYPNLVVLQTMSKAHGLAGVRAGFAYASPQIIELLNKTKPPYNVNTLTQTAVVSALNDKVKTATQISDIKANRKMLSTVLESFNFVKEVYPSEANFILARVIDANDLYEYLRDKGIIVRNRNSQINNCLRFTVGTDAECEALIKALKEYVQN